MGAITNEEYYASNSNNAAVEELQKERDRLVRERDAARAVLKVIPPERLESLARWLDLKFPEFDNDVQRDLREMAQLSRAALAKSGGGGGQPDDATLARLEKFKSGHKARACRISIDDGYGATCWAVELDVEGRGTVKASEVEMMRGGGDWPGLAAVINAALDTAEGVVKP